MGAPQLGAPPAAPPGQQQQAPTGPPMPQETNGQAQDMLQDMGRAAVRGGDVALLAHHLRELQQMYPKLVLAHHANGHAQMVGPAQEQFLAAAYARAHGAKVAHVRNQGRGQRLHLEF